MSGPVNSINTGTITRGKSPVLRWGQDGGNRQPFEVELAACILNALLYHWKLCVHYTAKNEQVVTSLLTSCNNLLQQADIRMRSHGLRQLVDDKSVGSFQKASCKLSTGLLQVVNGLAVSYFKTLVANCFNKLEQACIMTSCNKPDFNRLVATWWNWQACCNFCSKSVMFLAVYLEKTSWLRREVLVFRAK